MGNEPEWRNCPSLSGYQVSSDGRARRTGRPERKIKICKRGYHWLSVADGRGSSMNISMARLICEAFNGPPENAAMECDHINRNRGDNQPSNLRWVTRAQNLENRRCRSGEDHHHSKLTDEQVKRIRSLPFRRGQDRELATAIGVSRETVRDVRLGKLWRHVYA